jgi:single-strand DNA-binding protein
MAQTVNRVELIGYLGSDPKVTIFDTGQITNFSVATTRRWKNRDDDEWKGETEWSRVVTRGRLAELCAAALHKGSRVRVEGRLRTRSWEDRESGQQRQSTEIVATDVLFLDSRRGQDGEDFDTEVTEEI